MKHRIFVRQVVIALMSLVLAVQGTQPTQSRQADDAAPARVATGTRTVRAWVPDASYGRNGLAAASIGAATDTRRPIIVGGQTDGKLILRFEANTDLPPAIRRINADGSLDSTFGVSGTHTVAPGGLYDVKVAADDRIYLLTYRDADSRRTVHVERYSPTGVLQAVFDVSGELAYGHHGRKATLGLHLMPDGGWLISLARIDMTSGAVCYMSYSYLYGVFMLKRYSATGVHNSGYYGNAGVCEAELFDVNVTASGAVILWIDTSGAQRPREFWRITPDGKRDLAYGINGVAAAPTLCNAGCVADVADSGEAVLVNRAGTLANAFQIDGTLAYSRSLATGGDRPPPYYTTDVHLLPQDKLLLAWITGVVSNDYVVARVLPSGDMDMSYGYSGTVTVESMQDEWLSKVFVDGDRRVTMASQALFRLDENGIPDMTFGESGRTAITATVPAQGSVSGLYLQSTGRMVVAGTTYITGAPSYGAVRFDQSGAFDPSFALNGTLLITDVAAPYDWPTLDLRVPILPRLNDTFALVLPTTSGYILRGFSAEGAVDRSFGVEGDLQVTLSSTLTGSVLIAGGLQGPGATTILYGYVYGASNFVWVTRHVANGMLDATFASGGIWVKPNQSTQSMSAAVQADGRVLLRYYPASAPITRLNADGTVDGGFPLSNTLVSVPSSSQITLAMPDGRVVLADIYHYGYYGADDLRLTRLLANGMPDTIFGDDGVVYFSPGFPFPSQAVNGSADSVCLVGYEILCVDSAGKRDATFGLNGVNLYSPNSLSPRQILVTGTIPGARTIYVASDSWNWYGREPKVLGVNVKRMVEKEISIYGVHLPVLYQPPALSH